MTNQTLAHRQNTHTHTVAHPFPVAPPPEADLTVKALFVGDKLVVGPVGSARASWAKQIGGGGGGGEKVESAASSFQWPRISSWDLLSAFEKDLGFVIFSKLANDIEYCSHY